MAAGHLLCDPLDDDAVPVVVVEPNRRRLDSGIESPVAEVDRDRDAAVLQGQVEIVVAVA